MLNFQLRRRRDSKALLLQQTKCTIYYDVLCVKVALNTTYFFGCIDLVPYNKWPVPPITSAEYNYENTLWYFHFHANIEFQSEWKDNWSD